MREIESDRLLAAAISAATEERFAIERVSRVAGGCINQAQCVEGETRRYFVKFNEASKLAMFEAEAGGLEQIAASHSVRVPAPVCCTLIDERACLVLEWIDLDRLGKSSAAKLGEALARMHSNSVPKFGWSRDNTIGATAQINAWHDDWVQFWRRQRLGFQLQLATANGYRLERGDELLARCGAFFDNYRPQPSLLHGDLWGGNAASDRSGEPVVFDPAVYFGDREADIAMTELFGGFPSDFHAAYRAAWPLDSGYRVRKDLYNLYHVLNHLNLFGGGYLRQAHAMIAGLLRELG